MLIVCADASFLKCQNFELDQPQVTFASLLHLSRSRYLLLLRSPLTSMGLTSVHDVIPMTIVVVSVSLFLTLHARTP